MRIAYLMTKSVVFFYINVEIRWILRPNSVCHNYLYWPFFCSYQKLFLHHQTLYLYYKALSLQCLEKY